eukprot:scaffold67005_cov48-Phaeocystis_antarctica.AAC.1
MCRVNNTIGDAWELHSHSNPAIPIEICWPGGEPHNKSTKPAASGCKGTRGARHPRSERSSQGFAGS